jgi:hypothetical protein
MGESEGTSQSISSTTKETTAQESNRTETESTTTAESTTKPPILPLCIVGMRAIQYDVVYMNTFYSNIISKLIHNF